MNGSNLDPLVWPQDGLKVSTPKHFVTGHCTAYLNQERKKFCSTGVALGQPQVINSIACCYAPLVTGHCTVNLN